MNHNNYPHGYYYYGGEPPYHMSGGGQGMRPGMHHPQPQQPPTPPTQQQDMKNPAPLIQPQQMHQQQQQGPPSLVFGPMNQRPNPGNPYYRANPGGVPRPQTRPNMMISQQAAFIPSQQVQYHNMNSPLSFRPTYILQGSYGSTGGNYFPGYQPVRPQPMQTTPILMQHPAQAVANVMAAPQEIPSGSKRKPRPNALKITDPNDGHDVLEAMEKEDEEKVTPSGSGESSARETPLPVVNNVIASEFARKVASTLGDEVVRPGSRNSTFSESEPQLINPELKQNIPRDVVTSPKLDGNAEVMVMSEPPMPEPVNNVNYVPEPVVPRGWAPVHMDHMGVPLPMHVVMPHNAEELMRSNMHAPPPPRDFQAGPQWPPEAAVAPVPVGVPVGVGMPGAVGVPPSLMQPMPLMKKQERSTPVVSANAGPTVDISRDRDYPVIGGQRHGNQQSPIRTKRRPPAGVRPEAEIMVEPSAPPPPAPVMTVPPPVIAPVSEPPPPLPVYEEPKAPSPEPAPVAVPEPDISTVQPAPSPSPPAPVTPVPPTTAAQPPVEAKVNHQKGKSSKRQQRQEQQRQATPPPAPQVTVVSAPPPAAVPTPTPAPVPEPAPVVEAPLEPAKEPTPPPVSEETPKPQRVSVEKEEPVVADNVNVMVADETPQPQPEDDVEQRTRALVAAMNDQNDKLTASTMLLPTVTDNNNVAENNNDDVVVPTLIVENSRPVLKHIYPDDQWSPLNVVGKKQYGRDFIMQLQNDPLSKRKPENLPPLEVLKDSRTRNDMPRSMSQRMSDNLMPNFAKSSSMRGSIGGNNSGHMKRSSQHGKQGPKINKPSPQPMVISLSADVELRNCENAWKPSRNAEVVYTTEDEKKTDILYKKVRGVLNRLTPQKFAKLVSQVRALPIDNKERLQGVINLVFLKAVDEPGYSVAYAQMCAELGKLSVNIADKANNNENNNKKPTVEEKVSFRTILVLRCQKEFEKNPEDELNKNDRLQAIADETDQEKKKEMQVQLEEDERRLRVKSVGNIRFIGELYKLRMINSQVMFSCIDHLLRLNTEESLECLCKLLTTIGRALEEEIANAAKISKDDSGKYQSMSASMSKYFTDFKKMIEKKSFSSRVRFMFMDLIDLRDNKWVPRRNDTAPKTMDQIVRDAEREQLEQTLALSSSTIDRRPGGGGPPSRMDSRASMDNNRPRRGGGQDNADVWFMAGSGNRKSNSTQRIDHDKLRKMAADTDIHNTISLGSRTNYQWGTKVEPAPPLGGMSQNRFASLAASEEKPQSRSSSLKGPETRERPSGPNSRPSLHDERNSRSSHGLRLDSKPSSRESSQDGRRPASAVGPAPIDAELNENYTKSLLQDYVTSKDLDEVRKVFEERFADSCKGDMVYNTLVYGLEKSLPIRRSASKVLSHFLRSAVLSHHQFFAGLSTFLEQSEDLIVDIPRLWEYLGELLADVVADGTMPLNQLMGGLCGGSPGPLKTVATMLKLIGAERPGAPCLAAAVPTLRAHFAAPLPYEAFLNDNSLEFLENAGTGAQVPPAIDETRVTSELLRLLQTNVHFDAITQWVDVHVGPGCSEPAFVRALTNALLDHCLVLTKDVWRLDTEVLLRHLKLMSRYVDNSGPRELQCLFAIQAKMTKLEHPKGVLCELCQFLSDQGVISSDSFKAWRSSKDPQNFEGRGVCMKSLTSFFTMIDEDEDDAQTS